MIANILDRSALAAKRIVRQLPGAALDLLFPLNRLGCQQEDRGLCASWIEALPELPPPVLRCLRSAQRSGDLPYVLGISSGLLRRPSALPDGRDYSRCDP